MWDETNEEEVSNYVAGTETTTGMKWNEQVRPGMLLPN